MKSSRSSVFIFICLVAVGFALSASADSEKYTELKPVAISALADSNQLVREMVDEELKENAEIESQSKGAFNADNHTIWSLHELIDAALADHPALRALEVEYQALDNVAWQEGRRPNPEVEIEIGDFAGTGETAGFGAISTSLTYSQLIERGGKRDKRVTAAMLERDLLLWEIRAIEHEIQTDARLAYRRVQLAKYESLQLELIRELLSKVHSTIAAGVEAGRNPRLELERIEIELAQLDLEQAKTERRIKMAEVELATVIGVTEIEAPMIERISSKPPGLTEIEGMYALLEIHPDISRYETEYQILCAKVDLANAIAVPDLSVFGGVSRTEETSEASFNLGVSLELPLNDRNQGAISAARKRLDRLEDDMAAVRRELEAQLTITYQMASNAYHFQASYDERLLPAAREVLNLTEEGYLHGKFDVMDVLDAQRTVLDLEMEKSAALIEYYEYLSELEALLNTELFNDGDQCTINGNSATVPTFDLDIVKVSKENTNAVH